MTICKDIDFGSSCTVRKALETSTQYAPQYCTYTLPTISVTSNQLLWPSPSKFLVFATVSSPTQPTPHAICCSMTRTSSRCCNLPLVTRICNTPFATNCFAMPGVGTELGSDDNAVPRVHSGLLCVTSIAECNNIDTDIKTEGILYEINITS